MGRLALLLAVLVSATLFSSEARADKRIAVLEIEGARSGELRQSIVKLIRPHKALPAKVYRNAAKRLRAPKLNPKSVARVANYLDADGVIDGALVASDGKYRLTIVLRSGTSGMVVKKISVRLAGPKLSDKIQRGLRKRMMAAISDLSTSSGGDGISKESEESEDEEEGFEDDEEDEGADEKPAKKKVAAKAVNKVVKKSEEDELEEDEAADEDDEGDEGADDDEEDDGEEDDGEEDDDEEDDDEEDGDEEDGDEEDGDEEDDDEEDDDEEDDDEEDDDEPRWQDARTRPFILLAGLSMAKRTLVFTASADLENPPAGYRGGIVPGMYVAGELYPMAFGKAKGGGRNVGITFQYQAQKIESSVTDPATMMATALPTTQNRWGIGGAYRIIFGKSPTMPSLTLLAGYHRSRFMLDKSMAPVEVDVPNTSYAWIDPGARFRIGMTRVAALNAEARFLLVMDAGQIQQPEHYGAAKITGVDADVSVEYWITPRYLVRVGGRYTALGYDFQGNGLQTDRDGDDEVDVGGALDAYLGGYATLGVGF